MRQGLKNELVITMVQTNLLTFRLRNLFRNSSQQGKACHQDYEVCLYNFNGQWSDLELNSSNDK